VLASPELSSEILRLRAFEERLRKKEAELAARETAVDLVDARLKLVHQLRQQVEARERAVQARETDVLLKERGVNEIVRAASAGERTQLSALLKEVDVLRARLTSELAAREDRVRDLEAHFEPRMLALSAKEENLRGLQRSMREALDSREAEVLAMLVGVRDAAAQFRAPAVEAQARAALLRLQAGKGAPEGKEEPTAAAAPWAAAAGAGAGASTGADAMFRWLDRRLQAIAAPPTPAAAAVAASSGLSQELVLQSAAQGAAFHMLASPPPPPPPLPPAAAARVGAGQSPAAAVAAAMRSPIGAAITPRRAAPAAPL